MEMTTRTGAPVLVGVDGSPSSLDAVRLAARLAGERSRRLRIVHAFIWPLLNVPLGPSPIGPVEGGLANEADRIVKEAMAAAQAAAPGLEVAGDVIVGAAAPALLHAARESHLVVLGDRGLGGFTSMLIGSVAIQVAAHAPCPVLVARGSMDRPGEIVVGVEVSDDGHRALDFAFEEAAYRAVPLVAVRAFTHPMADDPGDLLPLIYDADDLAAAEEAVLAEMLAGRTDRYPEVVVRRQVRRQRPAGALLEAAATASLLVVGCRGRGGFAGLLLGSVSQAMLHHAPCPVALIR